MYRKPDTVTLTYESTTTYVVDLVNGMVKIEHDGAYDAPIYSAMFAEGEFISEQHTPDLRPFEHDDDQEAYEAAQVIAEAAMQGV